MKNKPALIGTAILTAPVIVALVVNQPEMAFILSFIGIVPIGIVWLAVGES